MDALPSSVRSLTEPLSLPDQRSLQKTKPTVNISAVTESVDNKSADNNNTQEIAAAVDGINYFFDQVNRELRFERSDTGGKIVIQVLNQKTGELIRQIPSEAILKISQDLDKISGLLFKDTA